MVKNVKFKTVNEMYLSTLKDHFYFLCKGAPDGVYISAKSTMFHIGTTGDIDYIRDALNQLCRHKIKNGNQTLFYVKQKPLSDRD